MSGVPITETGLLAQAAAQALVDSLWPEGTVARQLTCSEADTIAAFIEATLGNEKGDLFIQAHSIADGKDDEHFAIGLTTRERGIGWKP